MITTTVLLVASLLSPVYPRDQALQHAPTVIAIVALIVAAQKKLCSLPSFACINVFLWLHILGARYVYSFVPYDQWSEQITGKSISEIFDWNRNHYDRLVHLLFGCLAIPPFTELARKYGHLDCKWAATFALLLVLSVSALYEIFEWLLTVVMAPRRAEAYNGQQGDLWDAQKDMALAFAGSILGVLLVMSRRTRLPDDRH